MAVDSSKWPRSKIWIVLSHLALAFSQEIHPSNSTALPVDPNGPQLVLNSPVTTKHLVFNVDPLTTAAGLHNQIQQLQSIKISGNLVLTNDSNSQSLQPGALAYISCEPGDYKGYVDVKRVVRNAAEKIAPSSNIGGAIILYSTISNFCTFDVSDGFMYQSIYTTTNSSVSMTLKNGLLQAFQQPGVPPPQTTISLDQSSLNNNTASTDALGPSPTTAVAMIILYSITGIITALFLIIIVTGAIRAHRHPERYGPRQIIGRPRQSRAKGIARAMLETIPIVKFGERDEDANKNAAHDGDVELGVNSQRTPSPDTPAEHTEASSGHAAREVPENNTSDEVTTVTAPGIGDSDAPKGGTLESNAENGLACSVCTDDFVKGQDIRLLPCNHKFHPECIDPWLLNVSGTCPLCRVDLRPTASQNEPPSTAEPHSPNPYLVSNSSNDAASTPRSPSLSQPGTTDTNRRRSGGLALYIHHTLNARRMRDATPDERIAALRRVRTAHRASGEAEREGGMAVGERTVRRVQGRLSRLWDQGLAGGPSNRHSTAEVTEGTTHTGDERRRGSFAG